MTDRTETDAAARVRVVAGSPTPEELAAVVAVLQSQAAHRAAAGPSRADRTPRAGWPLTRAGLRAPLDRGPDAWARSLR